MRGVVLEEELSVIDGGIDAEARAFLALIGFIGFEHLAGVGLVGLIGGKALPVDLHDRDAVEARSGL